LPNKIPQPLLAEKVDFLELILSNNFGLKQKIKDFIASTRISFSILKSRESL